MAVHQVTSVHLILSESGSHLLVDIPQTIVFRGSGINDGDMAKVRTQRTLRCECSTHTFC